MKVGEARAEANRVLSYGYFRPEPGTLWVTCPECRERVTHIGWVGDLTTAGKETAALREALVEHLVREHAE